MVSLRNGESPLVLGKNRFVLLHEDTQTEQCRCSIRQTTAVATTQVMHVPLCMALGIRDLHLVQKLIHTLSNGVATVKQPSRFHEYNQ